MPRETARCQRLPTFALLLAALASFLAAARPAAAIGIVEYSVHRAGAAPAPIATGADGNLWFIEAGSAAIGRMSTAGVVTGEFPVAGGKDAFLSESPSGITAGPDGNVWFTEAGASNVGRVTPAGVVSEFPVPTANAIPVGITAGPDGNLWFTEYNHGKIGRVTPSGAFTEFSLPSSTAGPVGIAAGADGNLWFTELGANKLGFITTAGVVTEFAGPTEPNEITRGPDGNLWFTTLFGKSVGRITLAGVITDFMTSQNASFITAGPDGNLWFTEPSGNRIGSVTPGGQVSEYPVPTPNAQPYAIAAGPDGNLWFTEEAVDQIGRASPGCVASDATLCIDDQTGDSRWQVTVAYSTAAGGGAAGNGHAIPLASLGVTHGGLFWFFGAGNPEMLIKVLNACSVNQSFWVFSSAATDVGFTVTVKDTRDDRTKVYRNTDGKAAVPVQDTSAFSCTAGDLQPGGEAAAAWAAESEARAGIAAALAPLAPKSGCAASPTAVCIGGRFLITVKYRAGGGQRGNGNAIGVQSLGVSQGGLFWFFGADNPEMLIKVLDGCSINQRFWIFYAAGTNVGFTVTVTDTQTGRQKVYNNVDGTAAPPLQDTSALPCT